MAEAGAETRGEPLVLASASPRRRELLTALGALFAVESADIDEAIAPGEDPAVAAGRLAHGKVEAVIGRRANAYVLGADTMVILDGHALGKPADAAEATMMLRALRSRVHSVITAVVLYDPASRRFRAASARTTVWMRDYADAEIAASIAAGTPFDKAGAYAIQDDRLAPVERIEGCYCNVVGLPLWTVYHLLADAQLHPPPRPPSTTRDVCGGCPLASTCIDGSHSEP
jgi:septum formation protein